MKQRMEEITFSIIDLPGNGKQLKITGKGKITGYSIDQPWFDDPITEVYVDEGITEIGKAAFANLLRLERLWLPITLKKIRDGAFSGCPELVEIRYMGELSKMKKMKVAPDAMPQWFYQHKKKGG